MIARKASNVEFSIWTAALAVIVSLGVSYYPFENSDLKMNLLIALSVVLIYTAAVNVTDILYNKGLVALILLSIFLTILVYIHQIYNPPLTEYAENKFRNFAFALFFYAIVIPVDFTRRGREKFLLYSVLFFSLAFCVFGLFDSSTRENVRYSAIDLSPTMMAKITIIPCIFVLVFFRKGFFQKSALLLLFALSAWATIRSGSRGPVICLVLAYAFYLYLKYGWKGVGRVAIYVPFIALAFIAALYFVPPEISDRFALENLTIESNSDSGDRVFLWEIALNGLRYSWTGYGFGNFSAATFLAAPHNVILEMAYEVGVAIALLYAVIIFGPIIGLRKAVGEGSRYTDFFVLLYLMNVPLALISGEVTLTSALFYIAIGYLWGLRSQSPCPPVKQYAPRLGGRGW